MTEHSSIGVGGSTAGRVIACPPSRLSAIHEPPQRETVYMRRGTLLHEAMETWYLEAGWAGPGTPLHPEITALPDQEAKYHETVRVMELLLSDHTIGEVWTEVRVDLTPVPGAFGTIDMILSQPTLNQVTLLDYKFGDGVQVEAACDQLRFYAAAAMTDPVFADLFNGETKIRLAIVQPSYRSDTLRTAETDVLELFEFAQKLKWAVDNGHRDELLNPGDHCRWCPVKPVCPKADSLDNAVDKLRLLFKK